MAAGQVLDVPGGYSDSVSRLVDGGLSLTVVSIRLVALDGLSDVLVCGFTHLFTSLKPAVHNWGVHRVAVLREQGGLETQYTLERDKLSGIVPQGILGIFCVWEEA